MTFVFADFIVVLVILILYYLIHPSLRLYLLTAASMYYAYRLDPVTAVCLVIITLLIYCTALATDRCTDAGAPSLARIIMFVTCAICLLSLLVFKYLTTAVTSIPEDSIFRTVILPVGYSYYIFQAISYIVDVYKKRTPAGRNPVKLLLYLVWFPKLSSGPIERYAHIDTQLTNIRNVRFADTERWVRAITYIVAGCFCKLMIADRLAVIADHTFNAPTEYDSLCLILGSLSYTMQIYADFAGYSMLAMGISLLFGIGLTANFASPYCSENITEFWRRWHITLSTFLRDYIYIPLGGNRRGDVRRILNILIVFITCGLWHGIGWGFVCWGVLHALYSTADFLARKRNILWIRSGLSGRIITFCSVSFAWIFFKADTLTWALVYIRTIFRNIPMIHDFTSNCDELGIKGAEVWILLISVALMMIMDIYTYRKDTDIASVLSRWPVLPGYLMLCILIVVIAVYGYYGPDTSGALIYSQF